MGGISRPSAMRHSVFTSRRSARPSNDDHRCGLRRGGYREHVPFALLSFALCVGAHAAGSTTVSGLAGTTLCRPDEVVAFSCPTATKTVSLCAKPEAGPAAKALTYRYGTAKQVELEYTATAENGKRFGATTSPAAPGASVRQLWFNRGDIRYLLTECVGGSCPYGAGVAVLNPEAVLMSARCVAGDTPDHAFFARSLIEFGNDASDTRSRTPLIKPENSDNSLDQIYKSGRPPQ